MKIIDISWPVFPGMTGYKDAEVCTFTSLLNFKEHNARLTRMCVYAHVGTHVDAPSHFLSDGGSIDTVPLARLCGPCIVVDVSTYKEKIERTDLEAALGQVALEKITVLLKTTNSMHASDAPFDYNFVHPTPDAAHWLASQGISAIGIDYLGIEIGQKGHPNHHAFLEKNIPIIEGLRLAHVAPGEYTLICLPLKCIGIDGAPARAILLPKKT